MTDPYNYPPVPSERAIAEARGMTVAEVRERFFELETRVTSGGAERREDEEAAHRRDLEIARSIRERDLKFGHAPSIRSDVLSAELGTARTKAERRDAVARFMDAQPSVEEVRFSQWLREIGHGFWNEGRAAGESTGSGGGFLVPQRWNSALIRLAKEYDGMLSRFELWESPHGESTVRAVGSSFTAASADTENTAITDGPYAVFGQQSWGQCSTYAASARASNQLVQDAFTLPNLTNGGSSPGKFFPGPQNQTVDQLVLSLLAESLGRVLAPVASTGLYAAINAQGASSGQDGGFISLGAATAISFTTGATTELAANTIDVTTTAPAMIAALDVAYLDNAVWLMNSTQWAGILKQVDAQKNLRVNVSSENRVMFGYPVILTSGASNAAVSTVAGPVFGDLGLGMTLRVAGGSEGVYLHRSTERYAEFMQTLYKAALRADVAARDSRAMVGVKYNAT